MAKKRAGGASKSQLIRDAKKENPTAGPTEIATALEKAHGIKVTAAMVSTVLSQDRARGGKPGKRGRPPKADGASKPGRKAAAPAASGKGVSVDALIRIKKLADEMGGVSEAKRALDALSQLLG